MAVSAAMPWAVTEVFVPGSGIAWTPWTTACVFMFALGRTLHRQRRLIDELEQARRALATQAVAEERRRIARELHDLAGHTLAAVLLHVTGARHVLRRDVDEAERALLGAEAVGRASLEQIREVVGDAPRRRARHRPHARRLRGPPCPRGGLSARGSAHHRRPRRNRDHRTGRDSGTSHRA